jgi:histidine triad (HIT) family protein
MDTDCIFCHIVAGDAEASPLASSERAVAFLDILPVVEGHALVVPRRHVEALADVDDEEGAELFRLGRQIGAAQRRLGLAEGVNLFLADGEVAGQEIFHAHLHVVPRRHDDGMRIDVDYPPPPDRERLDATAARLRDVL